MTMLVRAELTKILTRPSFWYALVAALVAHAAIGITRLDALTLIPVYAYTGALVFAVGGEFRGGQIRLSLLAAPRRHRFLAAKLLAGALVALVAAAVVLLPRALPWRLLVAHLLFAVIGCGFALVARSAVVPVTTLVALPVLLSTTLGGVLPGVVRLLPHEAASSFLHRPPGALSPSGGLLVLTGWATGMLLLAWVFVVRRDA